MKNQKQQNIKNKAKKNEFIFKKWYSNKNRTDQVFYFQKLRGSSKY